MYQLTEKAINEIIDEHEKEYPIGTYANRRSVIDLIILVLNKWELNEKYRNTDS